MKRRKPLFFMPAREIHYQVFPLSEKAAPYIRRSKKIPILEVIKKEKIYA